MNIHNKIQELKKTKSFEHKNIFQQKGTMTLKSEHKLFEVDKTVLKDIVDKQPEYIKITLELRGGNQEVLLERVQINPNIITSSGTVHTCTSVHYRGIIDSSDLSVVALSICEDDIMGTVQDTEGICNLGKAQDEYIILPEEELPTSTSTCGTLPGFSPGIPLLETQEELVKVVQNYWEVGSDVCNSKGGLANTVAFITGLYNIKQTIYLNHGFYTNLKTLRVWDTPDPYTPNSTMFVYLQEFGTKSPYITQQVGDKRGYGDLAMLMKNTGGGGVAWMATLNSPNPAARMAFCTIGSTYSQLPTYSWTADVVCHEEGHNWGSPHTHDYQWYDPITNLYNQQIDGCGTGCTKLPILPEKGTIMSYCHMCSCGKNLTFHPQCVTLMAYYLSVADKIGTGNPPPPPVCTVITETQTVACATGYSGSITLTRQRNPDCTYTPWVETSNTCTLIPPPPCINPQYITGAIAQLSTYVQVQAQGCTNRTFLWKVNGIQKLTGTGTKLLSTQYHIGDTVTCLVKGTKQSGFGCCVEKLLTITIH